MNDSQNKPNVKMLTDVLAKSHPNLNCAPDTPLDSEINDPTYGVENISNYTYKEQNEKTDITQKLR